MVSCHRPANYTALSAFYHIRFSSARPSYAKSYSNREQPCRGLPGVNVPSGELCVAQCEKLCAPKHAELMCFQGDLSPPDFKCERAPRKTPEVLNSIEAPLGGVPPPPLVVADPLQESLFWQVSDKFLSSSWQPCFAAGSLDCCCYCCCS